MDPEKKSLNFIFPTKYVIPKSLSRLATGQVRKGYVFQKRFFKNLPILASRAWNSYSKKIACHTPDIAHPIGSPPATPTMKGIPTYIMLVKVARGVFQFGELKQP